MLIMGDLIMKNLQEMTKAELLEYIENSKNNKNGRKFEVLNLLKEGYDSIESIGEALNITSKNVSSILTALRKDGNIIINMRVDKQSILQLMTQEQLDFISKKGV